MLSYRMDEEEVLFPSSKGISVTWTNLTVVAEQKKNRVFKKTVTTFKKVIHNVNGAVEAGTLVAILGASGSGKSTLMSALANRSANGLHVDGHIKIGRKPIGNFVRHLSGFVYQNDLFFPTLTVYEHLNFTAKLRLEEMSENRRKNLIFQILIELGLLKVANSVIGYSEFGNEKMNLSGGERKRLSIANELLTDPSLLFCDEPTTGLDSFTALKVINNLKYLADEKHKTIICSVHQPNEKIFGLFHRIILLSGGKIAFSGSSIEALEFFRSQGYAYAEDQHPADYLIKSLASITDAPEVTNKLCSAFKTSEYYIKMMKYIKVENEKEEDAALFRCRRRMETSWFLKLWYATHRNLIGTVRDSSIQKTRIVEKVVLGTIIGVCLGRSAGATQTGLQTLKGIVFMLTAYNFFPPMHAVMDHVPNQLPIFFREFANNTNSPSIFYLSNVLSMLPGFLVDPICFTTLVYCLTTSSLNIFTWLLTCLITALVFNVSTSFGMFMSTAFSNRDIAEAYTFVIENIYFVCTGIFIKLSAIPISLTWIRYISWFTYAVEALYTIYLRNLNYIECSKNPDVPCLENGSEVLASLGFNEDNLWFNVAIMLFIYFFIHFMAYIGLLYRIRSRTT